MADKCHRDRCSNPYLDDGVPTHKGSNFTRIPKSLLEQKPHLTSASLVCNDCRLGRSLKRLKKENDNTIDSHRVNNTQMECDESVSADTLGNLDNSLQNNTKSLESRLSELEELLQGLKDKFTSLEGNDPMKIRILTIAPKSWNLTKIAEEFGTTRYLAKTARELRDNGGVLAEVTPRVRKSLPDSTIDKIIAFYNDDSISRMTTGVKETVTEIINNKRIKVQRRLLHLNLKELHILFKETYPDVSISFSAFAKLRPKHCILPGANGTHTI